MKTLMIAAAAFATLIVTSVTDADARPGFRAVGPEVVATAAWPSVAAIAAA